MGVRGSVLLWGVDLEGGCLAFLAWCGAVVFEQQARCLVYRGELGEVAGVCFCRAED